MEATVDIHVPQASIGDELRSRLELLGMRSQIVDDGERFALEVSFDDVHERLLADVTHAIETWLAEFDVPLVVQRASGGCVLRPPGD